jgi:hypothetical protein
MALTPIEMDLGALEAIASLAETERPTRKQSFAVGTLRKTIIRKGTTKSGKSGVTVELPGGSIMTVITPEQSAWQRAPYITGRIRFEPKTRIERSPLAIIQETVDTELGRDTNKIAAEHTIIDDLVRFIESFGDDFQVQEKGFDAFWTKQPPRQSVQNSRALFSPLSVASTLVQSPRTLDVPRLSKRDSKDAREEYIDRFDDLNEPKFSDDPPSTRFRRFSFALSHKSGSSRTKTPTPKLLPTHSSPPGKRQYGRPLERSPGFPLGTSTSSPRKACQVKGMGSSSNGQKMSWRGLLRNAASIV